jgi:hypothetical protein
MSAMSGKSAAVTGMLGLLAVCGLLGGCAGSGTRLPECQGTAVPINSRVATAPTGRAEASGRRSHPGTVEVGADDEP